MTGGNSDEETSNIWRERERERERDSKRERVRDRKREIEKIYHTLLHKFRLQT